ncbi:MAG: hypothetical protein JW892_01170 [Anaerolineae bacterium]|nr:hypothetical protein [Anaerolineae bacterium]
MCKRITFLLFPVLALAACASTGTPPAPDDPLRVSCAPAIGDGDALVVSVIIENVSDDTLYLFDISRMPYLLEEGSDLLILYGVNPPDPNVDYFFIEIPTTKALPPGARVEGEIGLTPLRLGDHYSLPRERNSVVMRHGAVTVQCAVGWGYTPILSPHEEQSVQNITQLLEWQHLSQAEAIQVQFP